MSVIQRIRDKGAWIIFGIIALALIAFILQDSSFRRGNIFSNTTTVGKVNGESISYNEFQEKLELYGRNGQDRNTLIPQLWNQQVQQVLMKQEFEKLGLSVGNKELSELLFSPNSQLAREFTDPQTGVYKVEDAKQAFAQLKKSKNEEQLKGVMQTYIEPTVQQALFQKYSTLFQQANYVPSWLIEKQRADNSAISNISYVYVPYSSISDSTVKVSDDEIMAYVKKHPKGFEKEEETRTFSYVTFDAGANADDSSATLHQLETMKNDFVAATDVKNYFAKNNSELPYYDGFIGKAQIQQAMKDTLFKLAPGQTFGPYLDANNYVIAKMIAQRTIPDTVKVRHILVATHDRGQTGMMRVREDSTAKKRMDTVIALINSGAKWDSVCAKFSDDPGSKDKGGVYENVTSGGMVPEFNDFIFTGSVGQKNNVKTDFGYHYIEILSQKGSQMGYKIAYLGRPINVSNATVNAATTAAQQFAANSTNKKLFDENAAKQNKQVMLSNEVKKSDFTVGTLQGSNTRQLVRWLYESGEGDVSAPTEMGDKIIVAIVTGVSKPGLPKASMVRPAVEQFVRNEKKAKQIIESKFKGNSLEAYASSAGTSVMKADSLSFGNGFVPGIGNEPKAIGAAFNKGLQGKASEPIAGNTGVISVKVEAIGAKAGAEADPEAIKQSLQQAMRGSFGGGYDALRKAATIKDYRSDFF